MTSSWAVSAKLPILGLVEFGRYGHAHQIARAQLRSPERVNPGGLQCLNFCRRSAGLEFVNPIFVARAADQKRTATGKGDEVEEDENNAAQSAGDIAEETLVGVATAGHQQSERKTKQPEDSSSDEIQQVNSGVLNAVVDSANQAAQTMQSNLKKAGEFVTGTNNDHSSDAAQYSGETEKETSTHGLHEVVTGSSDDSYDLPEAGKERSDDTTRSKNSTEIEETNNSGVSDVNDDDNDAAQYAAHVGGEVLDEVTSDGKEEEDANPGAEASSHDFGADARHFKENVSEQAQGFVDSVKSGAWKASEQVQAAGKDMMWRANHAFGRSPEEYEGDEGDDEVLKLAPEDFEEAFIEIDDESAKESIHL